MRTDLQRERHVALYTLVEAEKVADEREGHAGLQHAQRAPLRTYENRDRRAEAQPAKNDGNPWDNACRTFRQPQLRNGSGANEARNPSRKVRPQRTRSSADMPLFRRRQVGGGDLELLGAEMV